MEIKLIKEEVFEILKDALAKRYGFGSVNIKFIESGGYESDFEHEPSFAYVLLGEPKTTIKDGEDY